MLDCCALQADVERVSAWCKINGMQMNSSKCKVISFTRRQISIRFDYYLNNATLDRVTSIKDLGVIMDSKLRFHDHIAMTTAKANAMLGFLRRNSKLFDDRVNALIFAPSLVFAPLIEHSYFSMSK